MLPITLHFVCGHTEELNREETPEIIQKMQTQECYQCWKANHPEEYEQMQRDMVKWVERTYGSQSKNP